MFEYNVFLQIFRWLAAQEGVVKLVNSLGLNHVTFEIDCKSVVDIKPRVQPGINLSSDN